MWGPPVSGYVATRPALIGQAGQRPLSPRVQLKDGPDSIVRRPRTPVRACPVRIHAEVASPSALRRRLCASASVSGAAHSIEVEPLSLLSAADAAG
jgi:hypothetical protein